MGERSTPLLMALKDIRSHEKANIAVSLARNGDGQEIVVSRYGDPIWNFWPYMRQENLSDSRKIICWSFPLPDGTRLTEPKHAQLLESAKDYIWSLFTDPIEGRPRLKHVSLIGKAATLMHLIRWMLQHGMTAFRQLEGRTLDYVPVARASGSFNTIKERLGHLEALYLQAGKIADGLPSHPWPFETSYSLAYERRDVTGHKAKTDVIPDEVVKALAKVAIQYVTVQASSILDARDTSSQFRSRRSRAAVAKKFGISCNRALRTELRYLRTACYIVIAMFSGIRNSEAMSLSRGCIVGGKSADGLIDVHWLHGTVYKLGERPKRWLVPPIVETAITVLERYAAPYWQDLSGELRELEHARKNGESAWSQRWDKVARQQHKLFLGKVHQKGGITTVVTSSPLTVDLKKFCVDFKIHGPNGTPWPLAAHQFRRTFAYNYVKSQMGDLLYLQEHFGHRSLQMTLLYAAGGTDDYEADADLLDEIVRIQHKRQADIFTSLVTSNRPLARGDQWLGAWRRTVRTAKNRDELISELSDSIVLTGTGHSWCVGSAAGTGCGGLCVFEPAMCTECDWALITDEHLPVWKEIAKQQELVLTLNDIGEPGKTRARAVLGKAREIISMLQGSAAAPEDAVPED